MSTTTILLNREFITRFINKCPIIRSSRLDTTIKAIINNYSNKNKEEVVGYLNKIRIVYYLKRLEYRDTKRVRALKSTLYPFTPITLLLIIY